METQIPAPPPLRGRGQYQMLTQTNAGTPAGELLRRYWQPVALSSSLAAGGAPVAERIMGEDVVIFRDENGRPGVLAKRCAHRCADLSYGRVEAGGLRCVYHGWVFDVNGRCLETPAEPPSSTMKDRVTQRAYPCREAAGAVWAYFGPAGPPLFPKFPALADPAYSFATGGTGIRELASSKRRQHRSSAHVVFAPDRAEGSGDAQALGCLLRQRTDRK